jgi:hypothetical protein
VKAPPDGYTLLMEVVTANAINPTFYANLNYNFIRDIAPVASIVRGPFVMVVNPSVPAKTLPEFTAYAKANPGKINMASAGNGTATHLFGELFKMMAGVDLLHVPYRGSFLPDLLGGQVQVVFGPISQSRLSELANCAPLQSPPRRAMRFCRISRPWLNLYRATRRALGMGSARPKTHPPRSSTGSTRRQTRLSPIPR